MTTQPQPRTDHLNQGTHCAYCGHTILAEAPAYERFGERFCSQEHAEAFAEGVRAQRIAAVARRDDAEGAACAAPTAIPQSWPNRLRRAACWGAPLVLLLAIPLFLSGGASAVAGGSVLGLLAVLACPLGMYFMMRTMGGMHHGDAQHRGPRPEGEPSSPARRGER
ncbi:MAG: DUF2933 domain-containing protein [Candidatus Rokubacteria bacterium]|nr:DUF2933 domain-containing protein [Candidatus Rokubacteria bacterium]